MKTQIYLAMGNHISCDRISGIQATSKVPQQRFKLEKLAVKLHSNMVVQSDKYFISIASDKCPLALLSYKISDINDLQEKPLALAFHLRYNLTVWPFG